MPTTRTTRPRLRSDKEANLATGKEPHSTTQDRNTGNWLRSLRSASVQEMSSNLQASITRLQQAHMQSAKSQRELMQALVEEQIENVELKRKNAELELDNTRLRHENDLLRDVVRNGE